MSDLLNLGIKKLGFGLMRLPMIGDEVDIEQTKQMVDLFLESGFNYFDTAFGYLGGKSELAAGEALCARHSRESFFLATKLPAWAGAKTAEEAKNMFFTSLERTKAGYFDFYLLHNLGGERTHTFDDFGIWDFVAEQKAKGLIRHIGFSFHDKADVLDEILSKHPEVEFVQLQINYADWENPSVESRKCYETAEKYGKPVIIMEPVKGGSLANLPDNIAGIFKNADANASLSSWAIRFAQSLNNVITVLSGMSDLEQMRDNISTMQNLRTLSPSDYAVIAAAQKALDETDRVPCTSCGYCAKGCPKQINIPGVFRAENNLLVYNNVKGAKGNYSWETRNGQKAGDCIACGQCESVCPQHIKIIDELKKAAELFD